MNPCTAIVAAASCWLHRAGVHNPFNRRRGVASVDGQECCRPPAPPPGGPCGRTPVPYRPLPDPIPEIEQITDHATGRRSYRVPNGDCYPSITTVLGAAAPNASMLDWQSSVGIDVARHIMGTQAAVGTEVHERLSMYVRGLDPWKGYASEWDRPIDVRGHYDQLVAHACSRLECTVASEAPVWSGTLRVAGSVDLVAVLDHTWGDASGDLAIVDFKCLRSVPPPDKTSTYLAQCAAYAVMWTERTGQAINRMVVAQSIASGGVRLAVSEPGGRALDEFVRRKVEFDRMGIPLPGRDYQPEQDGPAKGAGGGDAAAPAAGGNADRQGASCTGGRAGGAPMRPFVVWMTGLPSSGKSTILRELRRLVPQMVVIGAGEIREWFASADHTRMGRSRHSVRIARLAAHLYRSGVAVGVATCSPYPENRHAARGIIGADAHHAHIECYVRCPKGVCEARDRHGQYEMARAGHMPWLTGEGDPYIPPTSPDLTIDSERDDAATSAARILEVLRARSLLGGAAA